MVCSYSSQVVIQPRIPQASNNPLAYTDRACAFVCANHYVNSSRNWSMEHIWSSLTNEKDLEDDPKAGATICAIVTIMIVVLVAFFIGLLLGYNLA